MAALRHKIGKISIINLFFSLLILLSTASWSAKAGMIRDTELERGLEALALPMAQNAGLRTIHIRLVPDVSYNAFVVGGNTVYVHTGLLIKAKSTAEILGVFAHEIGHLAAGHAPRRTEAIKDANLTTTLATLAAAAVAASGASGDAALGVAIGGADRASRNYFALSRQDEAVADEWALRLLKEQDISASGLSSFMRRIAGERALPETRQSDYYRSHPGAGQRLLVFEDHIREYGTDSPGITADDDRLMIRLIAKIKAFTEPPMQTLGEVRRAQRKTAKQKSSHWPEFNEAENLYRAAIAHYRRGALAKAEEHMAALLEQTANDPYYLEFAGDIYLSSGQIDKAITSYQKALRDNQAPLIEFGLGRALLARANQGDQNAYGKAVEAFQRALIGERKWPELYRQYAIALGRNGALAEADLALANEALLLGDKQRATQMARRALAHDGISKESQNYANDILFSLQ